MTVCLIYKKKKISFAVPMHTPFGELTRLLYSRLQQHLAQEQLAPEKIHSILKGVVGFESVDGDVNFDYRLSLGKGQLEGTKFF